MPRLLDTAPDRLSLFPLDQAHTGRPMLFLLKLTITPVLVALMSLAARRWGPTIGGLVMGLPWMTGPIVFFLGLERGETYAAQTAVGVLAGAVGIGSYIVAYVYTARHAPWPISLPAAFVAYAVTGYAASGLEMTLWVAAISGAASLYAAFLIVPRVPDPGGIRYLPWWDIPMRMLSTAVLVAIITVSADYLGPELSGVVATYPVILSVISAFTHSQWGWASVAQLARGVSLSLLSFVVFFLVVGLSAEALGLIWAFVLASAATTIISAALVLSTSRRQRAQSADARATR